MSEDSWYDDYVAESEDDYQIDEYDLTATPNDFNVLTIFSFVESGAVKIPGFQRNYVWDLRRASKLIESLILGLPVPQLFLYEEARNRFLVIDGQQRLMSIYYFVKQRFPRKEKRVALRRIFDTKGGIPDEVLHDDSYFQPFKLSLSEQLPDRKNKFKGLNYATLGEYKTQFDLRPIRNVIVKQNRPPDDDSCVFEMFNRLNTGGINLRPQEIRGSLYHSSFYETLQRINADPRWRRFLQMPEPDIHMKDVEILLRAFAMLIDGGNYRPSMSKFLNRFSRRAKGHDEEFNKYLEALFGAFLKASSALPPDVFFSLRTKRFSIALFEAAFAVVCGPALSAASLAVPSVPEVALRRVDADPTFVEASEKASADKVNVERRLALARAVLLA
jgi:uncharacterized protein with ParB-like and HNH nuclease domain